MIRKIQTPEELERKKKRNARIISVSMLLLLLISSLGFAFITSSPTSNPEGSGDSNSQFEETSEERTENDRIQVQYQGTTFNLLSTYNEIKNITINTTISPSNYSRSTLYISANNTGILQEFGSTIGKLSPRLQKACYGPCGENIPEKNCSDYLIVWTESEKNEIYQEDKCVFIKGDMRAVDAFIYNLFNQE